MKAVGVPHVVLLWILIAGFGTATKTHAADERRLAQFEADLDVLRQRYNIPGLSAAILKNQRIVWEAAYGYADVEKGTRATPDTPYLVASLTKTFASVLLMQCVESGKLNLDDPIIRYSSAIAEPGVTVRHVLTHTSESRPPGQAYRYNGSRFGALTAVVDQCAGMPFRVALARKILDPLQLQRSMPGKDTGTPPPALAAQFSAPQLERYAATLADLAKPYRVDTRGIPRLSAYPQEGVNAAAGIISTVRDLATYDAAVDRHALLSPQSQQLAWTNHTTSRGESLPYALGWFVQHYGAQRLVWHYGYWDTFSALLLKVPERGLTLILLCNSDGLSAPFSSLGAGDVTGSTFGTLFLRMINEPGVLRPDTPALTIGGVRNAADGTPLIAPGAWATVYGQHLGDEVKVWAADDIVAGVLPTRLGRVSVQVDGQPASIAYVSPEQINIQVPDALSTGDVTVHVEGPTGIAWTKVNAATVAPAVFVRNTDGIRSVVAQHADGTILDNPARTPGATTGTPGETVVLYATGLGPTKPFSPSGRIVDPAVLDADLSVLIGAERANVAYVGLISPGLYQINVQVPHLSDGDHDVLIQVGSARSASAATIAVGK
jgi:uncharacterized protein (TIGR03437 family)